ncbi:hypothetical protein [Rhizobium viscosum]|uniref:Uncharacterized protein n=1 Tax=Rhizobium viscosum TaxID=1673 RepID=A0ABR9IYJ1_RHIVS|nr:hypothetical protein [Rhizobium viscosum]MBE1508259.1 hypothetical protein [Rhizobium viscosum]
MEAEIFLICHEFSHGLLADVPPGSDAFLNELQVGLEGLSADWREELSADRLALFLAIGKRPGPRDGHQFSINMQAGNLPFFRTVNGSVTKKR